MHRITELAYQTAGRGRVGQEKAEKLQGELEPVLGWWQIFWIQWEMRAVHCVNWDANGEVFERLSSIQAILDQTCMPAKHM